MSEARERAESIPLVAGHPALDLVNTISWRGVCSPRRHDNLTTPSACLVWSHHAAIIDNSELRQLQRLLEHDRSAAEGIRQNLVGLRRLITATVDNPTHELPPELQATLAEAVSVSQLTGAANGTYRWAYPTLDETTPARRLALAFVSLLTTHGLQHLGTCDDPACRWVFLDTSRGHRRRWCDSKDCGNRHRVREYADRRSQEARN